MYDIQMAVLVRALTLVLLNKALTTDDKRYISRHLDAEIAALAAAGGNNVEEIAQTAVKNATKKRRQAQGVASRTSQKREDLRRLAHG
jgi:hypothetical protein